jgi:hypothetical protein
LHLKLLEVLESLYRIPKDNPMKHPLLATFGLAGACAACCAIPLAVPLLAGFSVAGWTAMDWSGVLGVDSWAIPVVAGTAALLVTGLGLWAWRSRKATACAQPLSEAGCGCASQAGAAK